MSEFILREAEASDASMSEEDGEEVNLDGFIAEDGNSSGISINHNAIDNAIDRAMESQFSETSEQATQNTVATSPPPSIPVEDSQDASEIEMRKKSLYFSSTYIHHYFFILTSLNDLMFSQYS